MSDLSSSIEKAQALLRQGVAVLSGAGLSKASGIPTYRDADGLWKQKDALRFSHADDLARDPAGFCDFWAARLDNITRARPNEGHEALVELQTLRPGTTLITQNVDGLLSEAGAQGVLELHGSLRRWRCDGCGNKHGPWELHRCPRCNASARPDVVMFGEMLDEQVLVSAQAAATECELFLVVGTTAAVYPAADLPVLAATHGASLVTINLESILIDDVASVVLRGTAESLLPKLLAGLQ